jgi:hypothetical protein
MKIIITSIILFIYTNSHCQIKCDAIIDWHYLGEIIVYEKPNGKITSIVKNDSLNEQYLHLVILDQRKDYFYVSIGGGIESTNKTGWIKKAKYIGAYKRHENSTMKLTLYSETKKSVKKIIEIKNWRPVLLTFDKCNGEMVLVRFTQNGKDYKGWIEKTELCANTYTTCG